MLIPPHQTKVPGGDVLAQRSDLTPSWKASIGPMRKTTPKSDKPNRDCHGTVTALSLGVGALTAVSPETSDATMVAYVR